MNTIAGKLALNFGNNNQNQIECISTVDQVGTASL